MEEAATHKSVPAPQGFQIGATTAAVGVGTSLAAYAVTLDESWFKGLLVILAPNAGVVASFLYGLIRDRILRKEVTRKRIQDEKNLITWIAELEAEIANPRTHSGRRKECQKQLAHFQDLLHKVRIGSLSLELVENGRAISQPSTARVISVRM